MSRRKPLAVLVAVMAAVTVAVPTASASAATTQPTVSTRQIANPIPSIPSIPSTPSTPSTPPASVCQLVSQLFAQQSQAAQQAGIPLVADLLATTLADLGCKGAAP
ncbi:MAG: hypothetical protein JWO02_3447 [Solirubrobacterales bacterium]|nr:hypothetical protein [Solirubrobacterales bacterium]